MILYLCCVLNHPVKIKMFPSLSWGILIITYSCGTFSPETALACNTSNICLSYRALRSNWNNSLPLSYNRVSLVQQPVSHSAVLPLMLVFRMESKNRMRKLMGLDQVRLITHDCHGQTDLRRENIIAFIAKVYSGAKHKKIPSKKPKNRTPTPHHPPKKEKKSIKILPLPYICLPQAQLVSFSTWYFWLLSLPLAALGNGVLKAVFSM